MNQKFDDLLAGLRGHRLEYSYALSEGCRRHCEHMRHAGLKHSPFHQSGECVAFIPFWDCADAHIFNMWAKSPKHRAIMTAEGSCYGVWFMVSEGMVYATFRIA